MSSLSHIIGPSEPALLEDTTSRALRRAVERFGDREALVVPFQGYRATYAELWEEVTRIAKGLATMGIGPGERVGLWSPNRYEWVVIQFAVARLGAVLVNINPSYQADELAYALNRTGVKCLLLARGYRGADYASILRQVMPSLSTLRIALVIDDSWKRIAEVGRRLSDTTLKAIELGLDPRSAANIQFTSGTTGSPKGATLSHRNLVNNGFFIGHRLRYTERDRVCLPVPFYHCFGMVIGTLAAVTHGACIVLPSESFEPLSVLRTIGEEKCTSLYGVPTMFFAELDHPRFSHFDLTSLRTGVMAGAPCAPDLLQRVQEQMHMREFAVCYGMTETSPVSTQTLPDDPAEKRIGTVGSALPHVEVKVVSPTGETVPRGERGEVCSRGYHVMLGYWEDERATRESLDAEGWMHTGDLGVIDEDGYLRIEGRLKDMILRGGENIYPAEIEAFLLKHPAVSEAYVVGVPSEKYGEEVMAWIKPKPAQSADEHELREWCRHRISAFKIPRYWKVVETFPMTVTGKVQKYRLREEAAALFARPQAKG